jgi:hypothetical protein
MNANATTPAIITINPNRELRKDQWKEMALQQQSHIGLLMKRLEQVDDICSSVIHDKVKQEKELEALKEATCDYEYLKEENEKLRAELAEIKENRFPCDVYWSATNGEITLYKIPNDVACLNNTDGVNAVLYAFQNEYFGEEWGSYSKLEVVEMTREMLEEQIGELVEREEEPTDIHVPITSALAHKMIRAYLEPESDSESSIDLDGDEYNAECSKCGAPGTWLEGAIKKNVQLCPECADEEDEEYERKKEPETPKSTKDLVIDQLNEEPHTPAAPAFEPIPEGHTQVVVGSYCVEFTWKVPAGINLNDTETYEFWDRWGCLRIRNKITDEMTEVEEHDETDDFKEANDLELHLEDEDGCRV